MTCHMMFTRGNETFQMTYDAILREEKLPEVLEGFENLESSKNS